ncbi:MAG: pseudouridine synthase [Clostridiales bacterium]|nr:pseudouridine synthase [Clostridiales bacterium]
MSVYYMFNKPKGYVTARRDELRPTVMDWFPEEWRDLLHPIGRLDIDTEGLLIITDDGKLDNRLMQPRHHIEKRYFFRALGKISDEDARRLESGIELYHSDHVACKAKYELEGYYKLRDVSEYIPQKHRSKWLKNPDGDVTAGYLTITEGKKHQVKLMIKSVGCRVFTLKRVRLGELWLDESLQPGEWREMTVDELRLLCGEDYPPKI